jgi:feruloyl esterase
MIPTMYHCNGGYGPSQFDMVAPIVDWVELGDAPDAIVATQIDDHIEWLGSDLLRPGEERR